MQQLSKEGAYAEVRLVAKAASCRVGLVFPSIFDVLCAKQIALSIRPRGVAAVSTFREIQELATVESTNKHLRVNQS